jgi:hypothetical protein
VATTAATPPTTALNLALMRLDKADLHLHRQHDEFAKGDKHFIATKSPSCILVPIPISIPILIQICAEHSLHVTAVALATATTAGTSIILQYSDVCLNFLSTVRRYLKLTWSCIACVIPKGIITITSVTITVTTPSSISVPAASAPPSAAISNE